MPSGLLKCIFLFCKTTQDVLCVALFVPFEFPEELFSKQTFQNECDSSMECLHCAWSISSPVVILNYRVIYLSYIPLPPPPPAPIIFTRAVTLSSGRGCIIFCESKLVYLSLFLNLSIWYFGVDQTKRKFLGFKK